MSRHKNLTSLDTLFAQANGAIDPQTGGVVPPIQSSTTFVRDQDNVPLSPDHIYGRDDNDLVRLGEQMLAKAEHADGVGSRTCPPRSAQCVRRNRCALKRVTP